MREQSNLVRVLNSSAVRLVKYEPMIVRGLAYYTSTVFEVFDTSPENRRALFGGGRYSDLASMFTPQQIPGIGFGMGDVTLIDFLDTHGLTPAPRSEVDVMVIPVTEDLVGRGPLGGGSLRAAGLRTSTPIEHRKLGKELTRADKAGAVAVVIVGQEDWAAGNVTVRSLATREQNPVAIADAPAAVQALLALKIGSTPLARWGACWKQGCPISMPSPPVTCGAGWSSTSPCGGQWWCGRERG